MSSDALSLLDEARGIELRYSIWLAELRRQIEAARLADDAWRFATPKQEAFLLAQRSQRIEILQAIMKGPKP